MGSAALSTTGAFRVIQSHTDQGVALVEAGSETFSLTPSRALKTNRFLGFLIHTFEVRADQITNYRLLVF